MEAGDLNSLLEVCTALNFAFSGLPSIRRAFRLALEHKTRELLNALDGELKDMKGPQGMPVPLIPLIDRFGQIEAKLDADMDGGDRVAIVAAKYCGIASFGGLVLTASSARYELRAPWPFVAIPLVCVLAVLPIFYSWRTHKNFYKEADREISEIKRGLQLVMGLVKIPADKPWP